MSKKILICDDEEGVRESLKLILSDHFDLIVTDSPQQCLDAFKNQNGHVGLVL
ncbi:MAG: sigma-54-dependent Fis family transcriptional regulator, partial [Candidatus Omnitrophica bacterium CG12_big_fil_rev_8_21_14_0_65_50_5]